MTGLDRFTTKSMFNTLSLISDCKSFTYSSIFIFVNITTEFGKLFPKTWIKLRHRVKSMGSASMSLSGFGFCCLQMMSCWLDDVLSTIHRGDMGGEGRCLATAWSTKLFLSLVLREWRLMYLLAEVRRLKRLSGGWCVSLTIVSALRVV